MRAVRRTKHRQLAFETEEPRILLTAEALLDPPPFDTEILYENKETAVRSDEIKAVIEVYNSGPERQDFNGIEIRYHFTADGNAPNITILGTNAPEGSLDVRHDADCDYVAFRITKEMLVVPSSRNRLIIRFSITGQSEFDQSNDLSFDPSASSDPIPNENISVHWAGAAPFVPPSGSLVSVDDEKFGPDSVTLDTATGLEWLDITQSLDRSFSDVASQFGADGAFEGWRHATESEVLEFFANVGISSPMTVLTEESYDAITALQSLIGTATPPERTDAVTKGAFAAEDELIGGSLLVRHRDHGISTWSVYIPNDQTRQDRAQGDTGHHLVRGERTNSPPTDPPAPPQEPEANVPDGWYVNYRNKEPNPQSSVIEADVRIGSFRELSEPVNLNGTEVRYFMNPDGLTPRINITQTNEVGLVEAEFNAAGSYVSFRVIDDFFITRRSRDQLKIRFEITNTEGLPFDQSNDPSFIEAQIFSERTTRIPVYLPSDPPPSDPPPSDPPPSDPPSNQTLLPLESASDAVFGADSVTFDPNSGLEWLDLTESTNRSFNDVASQFGTGGDYDGWRHATFTEVTELFENAELFTGVSSYMYEEAATEFIALFGDTSVFASPGTFGFLDNEGRTEDEVGSAHVTRSSTENIYFGHIEDTQPLDGGADASSPVLGHWLVKAEPPETLPTLDLEVMYLNKVPQASSEVIEAKIEVYNRDSSAVNLKHTEFRYLFDPDGLTPEVTIQSTNAGGAVKGTFVESGATSYAAFSVIEDFMLPPNERLKLKFEITNTESLPFDQSNDPSFIATQTRLAPTTSIEIQQGNSSTPTPDPPIEPPVDPPVDPPTEPDPPADELEVFYLNKAPNNSSEVIEAKIEVYNRATTSVDFNGVELRYLAYFDGLVPIVNVTSTNAPSIGVSVDVAMADQFVSFYVNDTFIVEPNERLKLRFEITSQSGDPFDQSNDFSFDAAQTTLAPTSKIEILRDV